MTKIISSGGDRDDPKKLITTQFFVNLKNRKEDMIDITVYVKKGLEIIEKKEIETGDSTDFFLYPDTYKIFVLFDREKLSWAIDEFEFSIPEDSDITIDLDKATIDDSIASPY